MVLNSNLKENLKDKIMVNTIKQQQEQEIKKQNYNNEKDVTKRLYYLDLKERKEQALKNEEIYRNKLEQEYQNYSFTPKISLNSENINKRKYKINNYKKDNRNKENIQIQRILQLSNEMSECKQFKSSKKNKINSSSKLEDEKNLNINKKNLNDKLNKINKNFSQSSIFHNDNIRKKIQEAKTFEIYEKECTFIPKINEVSILMCNNNPNRNKDFSSRLYEKKQTRLIKSNSITNFKTYSSYNNLYFNKGNKNNPNFKNSNPNFFGLKLQKEEEELNKKRENDNYNREQIHNISMRNCQKYLNDYKLKNLKDIYEKIEKCENNEENLKMENYDIDNELKNKLVFPVLNILKARNMEFNFQNFYIVCNELLYYIGKEK